MSSLKLTYDGKTPPSASFLPRPCIHGIIKENEDKSATRHKTSAQGLLPSLQEDVHEEMYERMFFMDSLPAVSNKLEIAGEDFI